MVSIHAPAWGATSAKETGGHTFTVSIHAPAWGATGPLYFSIVSVLFQSTHPHGVRLQNPLIHPFHLSVSIHAPARGATVCLFTDRLNFKVSIHAPARGATEVSTEVSGEDGFNPRTRTGCDTDTSPMPRSGIRFNPRTRTGCDKEWFSRIH